MTPEIEQAIAKMLEGTEKASKPPEVERESPAEGGAGEASVSGLQLAEVNYPSGDLDAGGLILPEGMREVIRPSGADMQELMNEQGVHLDSGLATALNESGGASGEIATAGYADTYPTHFGFRPDVRRFVNRMQAKFPWLTYANTYYMHPPVFGRLYEIRSVDFWAGGLVGNKYVGYRGKNINITVNGWDIFNAAFNDPNLPNIAWIIFGGYMWSWSGGWTSAPWGPAGSDAGHHYHPHISFY